MNRVRKSNRPEKCRAACANSENFHIVALIAASQKKRVAEISATRSFNELAVAGEAGRRGLAPDGSRQSGARGARRPLLKPIALVHYGRISA